MISSEAAGQAHPGPAELALYARSDLRLLSRLRIGLHVRSCSHCRQQLFTLKHAIRSTAEEVRVRVRRAGNIQGWQRLQQEMTGNIAVGLAAAQCIEHVDSRRRRVWLRVLAVCGILSLLVLGWMTHIPASDTARILAVFTHLREAAGSPPSSTGRVLSSTINGVSVSANDAALKIITPSSSIVFCSGDTTLRSSYVDDETGESTVSSVYAH